MGVLVLTVSTARSAIESFRLIALASSTLSKQTSLSDRVSWIVSGAAAGSGTPSPRPESRTCEAGRELLESLIALTPPTAPLGSMYAKPLAVARQQGAPPQLPPGEIVSSATRSPAA